jgi:hypothetical protein
MINININSKAFFYSTVAIAIAASLSLLLYSVAIAILSVKHASDLEEAYKLTLSIQPSIRSKPWLLSSGVYNFDSAVDQRGAVKKLAKQLRISLTESNGRLIGRSSSANRLIEWVSGINSKGFKFSQLSIKKDKSDGVYSAVLLVDG